MKSKWKKSSRVRSRALATASGTTSTARRAQRRTTAGRGASTDASAALTDLATRNAQRRRLDYDLTEAHAYGAAIIRTVPDPLVILTADLRLQFANDSFCRTFEISPAALTGRSIFEVDRGSWDFPRLRQLLERIIPEKHCFDDFE